MSDTTKDQVVGAGGDAADDAARSLNRRRMFLAGAGVAGAAALTRAGTASAADGDPVLVGEANETDDGATIITNTNATTSDPGTGGQEAVKGELTGATNGSHAVLGVTAGLGHAVSGESTNEANTEAATAGRHAGAGPGLRGVSKGGYGGEFVGGMAHVRLVQDGTTDAGPPPAGTGHLLGELYADGAGGLWYNTADGDHFVQLTPAAGRTILFTDPERAFDSREEFPDPANGNKGRFTAGETRRIDLTEFTQFPAGASGAVVNVAVDATAGAGFLTVYNGDTAEDDRPNAATMNWYEDFSIVANGVIVPCGADGSVNVYAQGNAGPTGTPITEVVIDVVGYVT